MLKAALSLALLTSAAAAQTMPVYTPQKQVSGTIKVGGDYHQRAMLTAWEKAFHQLQPGVTFQNNLTSTAHGIPALLFHIDDLGLLGREIAPLEALAFRRMFKYDATGIATGTGSFDTQYQAFALGIFVNRRNPLTRLTFQQAAAIFSCGPGRNLRTWGQLGLKGAWAKKPIHVFGYPTTNNIAAFFELKVLNAPARGGPTLPQGARWNCDLKEYENTYDANDKPIIASDAFMMRDLGKDPYAIAYSGIAELTPLVKPLPLSERPGAPYVPFTRENVAKRTYPLTRSTYLYLNKAPGTPLEPALEEFLLFLLSQQGQQATLDQTVFLPLPADAVLEQRSRLR